MKLIILAVMVGVAMCQGYGEEDQYDRANPFKFGYNIKDEHGNEQYRKEESDSKGNVKGSYGYRDAYGVYRTVEYVDDGYGIRKTVKTNEPGTGNESPADVYWQAEESQQFYGGNDNRYH